MENSSQHVIRSMSFAPQVQRASIPYTSVARTSIGSTGKMKCLATHGEIRQRR